MKSATNRQSSSTSSVSIFCNAFLEGMKSFGGLIVEIVNFILLIPAYILGIGLTSIVAKIVGKHFLNLKKPDKKTETYWVAKDTKKKKLEEFYRQF